MAKCDFVDPSDNYKCINESQTRIMFIDPVVKQPVVKLACQRHGDMRFKVLSMSEDEITKLKDSDRISYGDFRDKISAIRWSVCRRCNEQFKSSESVMIIEYFAIRNDTQIRMRRSFRLHRDCAISEESLYILKSDIQKNRKLDSY